MQYLGMNRTMVCAKRTAYTTGNDRRSGWLTSLLALAIVHFAFLGHTMPNYDPFANQTPDGGTVYTVGSNLAGQTNAPFYRWNALGTNFPPAKPIISSDNLSYAGLPSSTGGSVAFTNSALGGGGGARLDLKYTGTASGTFYYSFLLKITDLSAVPTFATNNPIAALSDDPAEQGARLGRLGSRLVTKKQSVSSYVLGIGRNNSQGEYVYDTGVHNLNEVVFVVASYELVGGVTNVNLWLNPDSSTFGTSTPPSPTVTDPNFSNTAGNLNSVGPKAMAVLCQFEAAPSGVLDDLRVGQTWATVTGGLDFTLQPTNQSAVVGSNVTFSALAVGAVPLAYTWQKDGIDLPNSAPYSGVTSRTLTITSVSHAQEGTYTVVVTNGANFATSSGAFLTVTDPILDPHISTQPVSRTNLAGTTATFQVVATGTPALTYSWRKGGDILFNGGNISGADTDTLTISPVSTSDQGDYDVVIVNGIGSTITSSLASLTVTNPPTPLTITAQPTPRVVPQGGRTAMAVGVSGTGPFTYQWQLAGADVSGATAAAYVISNVQASVTGNYRVIVTGPVNSDTSSVASVSIAAEPLQLAATNLVAIRIGNGEQALTARGNSIFLDDFAGGSALAGTLSIPDSGPTGMVAIGPNVVTLAGGGSSISGSGLSKSLNGQFLLIGGYNTNLSYTADLNASSATAVPRGIGLIDSKGRYTMVAAVTTAFGSTFWRGALADGTNNYWGWGRAPGTYYFGFDAPAALVQGDWSNLRSMGIFNGSIYGVSAVSGKTGVMRLPGLPTSTNAIEVLIDSARTSSSDCVVSPDGTIIYLADSDLSANGGGIQRWQFDGSSWALAYTLTDGLSAGAYYVAADFTGPNPVIYAVTTEAQNNRIVRIEDTGAGATGTVIADAGANQTFRGVRMGPQPGPAIQPLLSVTPESGKVILNWAGSYFLQSAPDVTGPYTDVINGTRPYTNSTISPAQRFFRLRQ